MPFMTFNMHFLPCSSSLTLGREIKTLIRSRCALEILDFPHSLFSFYISSIIQRPERTKFTENRVVFRLKTKTAVSRNLAVIMDQILKQKLNSQ